MLVKKTLENNTNLELKNVKLLCRSIKICANIMKHKKLKDYYKFVKFSKFLKNVGTFC